MSTTQEAHPYPFIPTKEEEAVLKLRGQYGLHDGVREYEPCASGCEDPLCERHCQCCGESGGILFEGYCAKCYRPTLDNEIRSLLRAIHGGE